MIWEAGSNELEAYSKLKSFARSNFSEVEKFFNLPNNQLWCMSKMKSDSDTENGIVFSLFAKSCSKKIELLERCIWSRRNVQPATKLESCR